MLMPLHRRTRLLDEQLQVPVQPRMVIEESVMTGGSVVLQVVEGVVVVVVVVVVFKGVAVE